MVFDMGQNRVGLAAANGVGGTVNGISATSDASITSRPVTIFIATAVMAAALSML
jgi:hypothetical protein